MITIIRPVKSLIADQVEKDLKYLRKAVHIIKEELMQFSYLIDHGQVFNEGSMQQHVAGLSNEWDSDSRIEASIENDKADL